MTNFTHDDQQRVHLSMDDVYTPEVVDKAINHCRENGLKLHVQRPADMDPSEHPPVGCIPVSQDDAKDFAAFEELDQIARRMGGCAVVYRPVQ